MEEAKKRLDDELANEEDRKNKLKATRLQKIRVGLSRSSSYPSQVPLLDEVALNGGPIQKKYSRYHDLGVTPMKVERRQYPEHRYNI